MSGQSPILGFFFGVSQSELSDLCFTARPACATLTQTLSRHQEQYINPYIILIAVTRQLMAMQIQ